MRPLRIVLWVGGLAALVTGVGPADAAWNNVFQVCCLGCKSAPPATSNYFAAYPSYSAYMAAYPSDGGACCPQPCCPQPCCPQPCPQQVCETRYVQRTYYQAEVHCETRTAYEAVTTYHKSYFWEPVTSYRVSCYFDSCSCSYRQVATPVTSFRLREQCCPVQSWVARCYSVPVTTMRPYTRCEPVTSCYWTTAAAPACPAPACPAPAQAPAVAAPAAPVTPVPGVNDTRPMPPAGTGPGVNDTGGAPSESQKPLYDQYGRPQGYRQYAPPSNPAPKSTTPVRPDTFVMAPPSATLGKVVPIPPANVEGVIVRSDDKPEAGARLTFKRSDREGVTHTVTADSSGRFKATLTSGGWVVCTHGADGKLVPQKRIDVRDDKTSEVKLTSR
jgi:hypothetical protein